MQAEQPYKLYQGDCLDLMQGLPDNSIDMVLCDLPYGCTRNEWDKPLDLQSLWAQYKRVIKSGGVMAMFAKQRFTIELAASNLKQFRYKIVWQKTFGTDFLNAKRKPLSCHEDICLFYDKQPIYNPQRRGGYKPYIKKGRSTSTNWGVGRLDESWVSSGDETRCPLDVITFKHDKPNTPQNGHSTAKPVALCEWLIKTYTNEGMTVLDNCMGSGTTGIACMNTGRRFIGMELNDKFFNQASERIAIAAPKLMAESK